MAGREKNKAPRGRQIGKVALKVLEQLAETAAGMADLFIAIHVEGRYGASAYEIERTRERVGSERERNKAQRRERQRFHELLYRLKQQGFVETDSRGRDRIYKITKHGANFLRNIRERLHHAPPPRRYIPVPDHEFKIVIFDVPERARWKRRWLRFELAQLGFTMVQKSVWAGKVKVPPVFLEDLGRLELLPYVELFAITKTGSLKNLTQ